MAFQKPHEMTLKIRTSRLLLREFGGADLPAFHAMLSDPAVMKFAPTLPHETIGQTAEWLRRRTAIKAGVGEDFVIEYQGRAIGKAGFAEFPEIGIVVGRDWWRQGFAREAMEALVERAFAIHKLSNVTARADPDNVGSLRLLRGLGFVETDYQPRALLVGAEWRDDVHLAIGSARWRARSWQPQLSQREGEH